LPPHGIHDARMAMAEHGHEYAADGVEISLSVDIPDIQPIGAMEDDGLLQKLGSGTEIDEGAFQ
jgi:hypothetical protein